MTTQTQPREQLPAHPQQASPVHYPSIQNPLWWGPVRQIDDVEELESLTRQGWCLIQVHSCASVKKIDDQYYPVERMVYVLGRAQQ